MIRAFFAALLLLAAGACTGHDADQKADAPKPALWAVENERGEALAWLFGTIHALPDDVEWMTPVLDRVLGQASTLVVEVRDLDPERVGATYERLASDEPVPPLRDRVPASAYGKLTAILATTQTPPNSFDALETWAAALAVARLSGTASSANGVDAALLARFAGRRIIELEGAERQLGIFDALPEREQRSLLAAVIAERDNPAADGKALAKAWVAGDLTALDGFTRQGLLADPALNRALSINRNHRWAVALGAMLEHGGRPLVAVGTAHMLGSEGLPALMARKGYRVRRIQ